MTCRHCSDLHPASFSHCPRTGHSLSAGRALVGRTVAGRYRVLKLIGEGGMGAVYVAEHLLVGRKVALKRLHPELTTDESAVARFQREARAAAATGHEHIVEILDLGFGEDGAPFLVMEYVRGRSLGELLEWERGLPPRRACRIVGQILAALSAVHGRGIIHRDLKPDNVLLTRRGGDRDFVKVVDFGVSKMRPEEGDDLLELTRTGVMLGTPFYMSPEQARGMRDLDESVDLFAAGVLLFECLTGRVPFDGQNYHQLLQAILSGKRPHVLELRPRLDPGLAAVVERAIAPKRSERFASAREMLLALVPHGAIEGGSGQDEAEPDAGDASGRFPTARGDTVQRTPAAARTPRAMRFAGPTYRSARPTARTLGDDPGAGPDSASSRARATTMGDVGWRRGRGPAAGAETPAPQGLAARPLDLSGPPRLFEARSSDWEPPPAGSSHSSLLRRSPHPSRRSASLRLTGSDMPAPERAATRIKGAWVNALLDHVRGRDPDLVAKMQQRVDAPLRARLGGVILPMEWLELASYVALLRAAEHELGNGEDQLAIEVGEATADRELPSTHRLWLAGATPTMAVERIPQLFRTYHDHGMVRTRPTTTGGTRVETIGVEPDTLLHALVLSGFQRRLLELTGGREVRATVTHCRERGDEATVTVLRWR